MIFRIISYLFLIIYTLVYTTNNYSDIFSMIGNSILILFVFGLIFYHYDINFKTKKRIVIILVLSIFCSLLTFGQLAYSYKTDTIEIKNISTSTITIDAIYMDGAKQKINQKYFSEYDHINASTKKTAYQQYNKTDDTYKGTLKFREKYKIKVNKKKKIKVELQRDTLDYDILIDNQKIKVKKIDKLLTNKANKIYHSNYIFEYNNINKHVPLYQTILVLVVSFIVYFNIFIRVLNHKKAILLLLPVLLIEINPFVNIDFVTKIVFFGIYLLFILKFDQKWEFKNLYQKILVCISSIYISFSFIGNNLIDDGVNFKIIAIFILFCIWIYHLFPFILNFVNNIKVKNKNKELSKKQIIIHRIIVFSLIVIIGLMYQLTFYPYIVPPDGFMQLQDINNHTLSNWHPYLHTLLMKTFDMIFGDVKFFIFFRIFVFATIFTNILFYFYQKNLSLFKIYLIALLLTILPVTGIFLVTLWKDVDFTLALVYLVFLIFLLIKDFKYFNRNKLNYLWLILSLLSVGMFRHNGIIVMFITIILILTLTKGKRFLLVISLIITCIITFIIKVPLYQSLKVIDAPTNFDIATIMHGFNRLIYTDNPKIDKDAYQYLTDKIPIEIWKISYDKYNIDLLLHYQTIDIRNMDINKSKVIGFYFKQFIKTPIELIKDRLYGIDIIWNVSEKDEVMTYKYQILYDEFETNYAQLLNIKSEENFLTNIIKKVLLMIANNEILNSLFFRVGIYIDSLILIFVYCILKQKKDLLACLIPLIINILTLLIAMHHYEYRYVWNVELVSLLFILIFIFNKERRY